MNQIEMIAARNTKLKATIDESQSVLEESKSLVHKAFALQCRLNLMVMFIDQYDRFMLVEEYCDEAEHQDGYECWSANFNTFDEMVDDFILYERMVQDAKEGILTRPIRQGNDTKQLGEL